MFEFIQQHKRLIIISSFVILIILVLGVVVLVVKGSKKNTPTPTTATNQGNYPFLTNSEIPKQDQYLMLTAKIVTEEYGTYSKNDYRSLLDVQNQSTAAFRARVESLIDSLDAKNSAFKVSTEVDPNSIKLTQSGLGYIAYMKATYTDQDGKKNQVTSTVNIVRQNAFWLIDNINFIFP